MCYCVNTSKQSSLKCCKEKQYTPSQTKDVIAVHSLYNKYPPFHSLDHYILPTSQHSLEATYTRTATQLNAYGFLQSNTTSKRK